MRSITSLVVIIALALPAFANQRPAKRSSAVPPRPSIEGFHIGMPQDSAEALMRNITKRRSAFTLDSLQVLESDSVSVFGQPAYMQLVFSRRKIRSVIVNFHPLPGFHYLDTRKELLAYLEKFFGRGVPSEDQSVLHRRWESSDGTHELSYSDKYTRIFLRLGKRR